MIAKLISLLKSSHIQSLLAQGLNAAFGFFSTVILARNIETDEFGKWVLFLSLVIFVEMLKSGMFQTALIKYISGVDQERSNKYLGTSFLFNTVISLVILAIFYAVLPFMESKSSGFSLFLLYYPLIGLFSIPFNYALWKFQAEMKFSKIVVFRGLQSFLLLAAISLIVIYNLSIDRLYLFYTIIPVITSLIASLSKNFNFKIVFSFCKETLFNLINFGKYHVFSFLGTNLLKSADVWLISLFLGPSAVAIFQIPLKLLEFFEIPVRSAVATALPKMSALHNQKKEREIKKVLHKYVLFMTAIGIPVVLMFFVFAPEIILLFAGDQYTSSVIVFRVFLVFAIFLPLDRMTGVGLIAINLPQKNLLKVIVMAILNIVGDIIALYLFDELWIVALVTIINTVAGAILGYIILNKGLPQKETVEVIKRALSGT